MTPSKRDEYARECGFVDAKTAREWLADMERWAWTSEDALYRIENRVYASGYIRRNLLSLALYSTRALLRVVLADLDAVGGEEGKGE